MLERHASRATRRAREFEAFVAGAAGRLLHPAAVSGILLGMATMFATGLLVSV